MHDTLQLLDKAIAIAACTIRVKINVNVLRVMTYDLGYKFLQLLNSPISTSRKKTWYLVPKYMYKSAVLHACVTLSTAQAATATRARDVQVFE